MLRDVFYYGKKPNVHPREKFAKDLKDARRQATTEHFWIINEFCDYKDFEWDFDFDFLPDDQVWTSEHTNVWPSRYQKDSGTWLCNKKASDIIVYRHDVDPVKRKNTRTSNWVIKGKIDETKFDFAWHPDPTDPPYIYQFPSQWNKTGGPRYHVDGATEVKYVDSQIAYRLPDTRNFKVLNGYKIEYFDYSWHPDESEEAYIYVFGNQHHNAEHMPTIEYHSNGAKQRKYINNNIAILGQDRTYWTVPEHVDVNKFDFSWKPNPFEPPFVYQFGTQWQKTGGPSYWTPNATEKKYVDFQKAIALPRPEKFRVQKNYKIKDFDYSWHPDETDEAYVYTFGNQYYSAERMPTITYRVIGARDNKYIDVIKATLDEDKTNWYIPENIDDAGFDYSWVPDPGDDQPYIYEFGTQWQKTGGPMYLAKGIQRLPNGKPIGERKYIDTQRVKKLPEPDKFTVLNDYPIEDFDYSWHPDDTETGFIYVFGNQWYTAEKMPTITYGKGFKDNYKYVSDTVAKLAPNKTNWIIPDNVDDTGFDYSWVPDPGDDKPYAYQFGTQWQKTGGPAYVTKGITVLANKKVLGEFKYIDIQRVKKLPEPDKFKMLVDKPIKHFDYSWHPDDTETGFIYVFGNQHYSAEKMPTIAYGSGFKDNYKYVSDIVATIDEDKSNWIIPDNVDDTGFDYSWIPDPGDDKPYVYQFGTQWQKTGGPAYVSPGLTVLPNKKVLGEYKYIETQRVKKLPEPNNFKVLIDNIIEDFDYSWHPDDTETGFRYVFGNQHYSAEKMPTIEYLGGFENNFKYIDNVKAKLAQNYTNWEIPDYIDVESFDFSWIPDPNSDKPYIYEFATIWNNRGGPRYKTPGAKKYSYIEDVKAKCKPSLTNWEIPDYVDTNSFDFSWRPHPNAPPFIYEFATVWNNRGGPRYKVPSATDYSYVENIKANCKPSMDNWEIPNGVNVDTFDFSWRPHPQAPAYIYQFGTVQDENDGPRYVTPNSNGEIVKVQRVYKKENALNVIVWKYYIETTLEDLVNQHPNEIFWAVRKNINYDGFDFTWRPNIVEIAWENDYVHVFGSPDSEITQTYFVNAKMYLQGKKDFKYVNTANINEEYLSKLFKQPDIFLVDRGNPETQQRFDYLKSKFTNVQKTRFLNSWVDTINRCINRSNTELCWILNSELDYSGFNFNYYPNPWQMNMVHVFGTQWSDWGTTFMVNKETFPTDTKYVKIVEHLKNLNFVRDRKARATNNLYDIYVIDHGNIEVDVAVARIKDKADGKNVKIVPYKNSYLETIKNIVDDIVPSKEHYVWITSSICNYEQFKFDFICDPYAKDNLHVFPSGNQKFGDTFLIDVNKTKQLIDDMQLLQQYHKINFNNMRVDRLPAPVIQSDGDTHVGSLDLDFDFPYAILQTEDLDVVDEEPMCLWSDDTKNILITSTGGTRIIVPKEAKDIVKNELYDYPYIKTASKLVDSKPLDIVFLSNGEKGAEENYEHLLTVTKGLKNRVVRVDGVNGRVQAYHAALEASETPWAFTVFAKLKINPKFDFNWQPDRLQVPKHYMFHAKNPVNGLEYGHQGMIAYNKKLTLANEGKGLDFTLDDPHETVELLSGTANFNTDAYSTWRTAFREVIKLKSDYADVSYERLQVWLTKAKGKFAKDCLQGSQDAIKYYDSVSGDIAKLRLTYEWDWLKKYYNKKYK